VKGFWNDPDGLNIAELTVLIALPPWVYTAYKYALAANLSANQVDFFLVLTYPLLAVLGKEALMRLPQMLHQRRTSLPQDKYGGRDDRGSYPTDIPHER